MTIYIISIRRLVYAGNGSPAISLLYKKHNYQKIFSFQDERSTTAIDLFQRESGRVLSVEVVY